MNSFHQLLICSPILIQQNPSGNAEFITRLGFLGFSALGLVNISAEQLKNLLCLTHKFPRKEKIFLTTSSSSVHHAFMSTKWIDSRAHSMKSTSQTVSQIVWWENKCKKKNEVHKKIQQLLSITPKNYKFNFASIKDRIIKTVEQHISCPNKWGLLGRLHLFNNPRQSY